MPNRESKMPNNETTIPMPDRPRGQYDWVLAQQTIANLRKEIEELQAELKKVRRDLEMADLAW